MNPSPDGIVAALLKGDYHTLIQLILVFVILHYGTYVLDLISGKLKELIAWLKGESNKLPFLSQTQIDDRFFDLLEKAVSNQVHLNAALAEAAADGKLDTAEFPKIVNAIFEDIKANTGVHDWVGFALALFGSTSEATPTGPSDKLEKAIKAKITSNLPRLLSEVGYRVGERRLERQMKARGLLQPSK